MFAQGFAGRTRGFRRRRIRPGGVLVLLIVIGLLVWNRSRQPPAAPEVLEPGSYHVARVVDGDTLLLENGARLRLIGIDAPETVKPNHPVEPWGPEAAAFTRGAVERKTVRLEFDKERIDRHGRFLAYVWYPAPNGGDEKLLNEELVRAGLATAELQYNNSPAMERRLQQAEDAAKQQKVGLWSRAADRAA